ncbi:uncharacterized protein AB675_7132 [Cyphellophora attinorum]|uniref:Rhodopsin domain-containing protein n=1 Tax=Cyphellophora attinorum TaxID=1664694 RepID=A0A0N0NPX6_9EURO|nr:uncharacterized protein AB675_7132 [Phialophora attinorum]KPI43248.1 hypothetical protein AB675_7132 [Phialophora attinorum]
MLRSNDATRALYICSGLSLFILFARLIAARIRYRKFDVSSVLVALSIVVSIARLVTTYYYLRYGTTTGYIFATEPPHLSPEKLNEVQDGSVLTLVSRALITTFYWLQICLLLLFYSGMLRDLHWVWTIRATWVTIGVTYVVCIILTFTGCRPFRLYYQVDPNPGRCVLAYSQLLSQGVCNIILDLLLLAIASPFVFTRHRAPEYLVRVWALYIIGCFTIITTILRIVYLYADKSQNYQAMRSFWASIQMLTATVVANLPTLYGCLTMLKRRKSEQTVRRKSRPELWPAGGSADPVDVARRPFDCDGRSVELGPHRLDDICGDDDKAISRHISHASREMEGGGDEEKAVSQHIWRSRSRSSSEVSPTEITHIERV